LLTGGDPLIAKESFPFSKFISENYPRTTIFIESNGIAFSSDWQKLAAENLLKTKFSVNASNEEVFAKGCWEGDAGKNAYKKMRQNIQDYTELLRGKGLEVFAPHVTMVVNKDTASDILDFAKFALSEKLHHVGFLFDSSENDCNGDFFSNPDIMRPALLEVMKLERVLARKFFVFFRLFMPLKELEIMQPKCEEIPINDLRGEYRDILELANGRSMKEEHEQRNRIRKAKGKKEFTLEEDYSSAYRQITVGDKLVCNAPFGLLDIFPNNTFDCCCFLQPRFDLNAVQKNNGIDWEAELNNTEMRKMRKNMLNGRYDICMKSCPLNPASKAICDSFKYNYNRVENVSESENS
jgi:hypothetical protein